MYPPGDWERAVANSLTRLARNAARPALEAVPANAEAVLFADRAEVLACLASDWCEGSAHTRWWWQGLFKEMDILHTILPAWLEEPVYIPAALQLLATRGMAVLFTRSLCPGDARALLQGVTRGHALYALQAALDTILDSDDAMTERSEPLPSLHKSGDKSFVGGEGFVINQQDMQVVSQGPPWLRWVPECRDSQLGLEQQCLLGIGLMMQRAPAVVRTQSFASSLLQWSRAERAASASAVVNTVTNRKGAVEPEWLSPSPDVGNAIATSMARRMPGETAALSQSPDAGDAIAADHPANLFTRIDKEERSINTEVRDAIQDLSSVKPVLPAPGQKPQDSRQDLPLSENAESTAVRSSSQEQLHTGPIQVRSGFAEPSPHNVEAADSIVDTAYLLEAHIETALGGLFYLINLGLFLGLYGDFTTPAEPSIALPIWDFVALLGQQLLGEGWSSDPVWLLLAQLAGRREQEAPGRDFMPPHNWRLSEEWLEPFSEEGTWLWSVNNGRLRVQHPAQFLVIDLLLEAGDPVQQLELEMQPYVDYATFKLQEGSLPEEMAGVSPLERWLGWLMPYVRVRLCRALDLAATEEPRSILCVHRAQVFVTATHLDIVLSLGELPIEIRLAGLDRNPGWVPAAGRLIAFHFE